LAGSKTPFRLIGNLIKITTAASVGDSGFEDEWRFMEDD